MAGRIIDLVNPQAEIHGPVVLDSNVIIARWLASYESPHTHNVEHAQVLFRRLLSSRIESVLTPVGYSEVIHAAVRAIYREARLANQSMLSSHLGRTSGFTWRDLYKLDPTVLREQSQILIELRGRLIADHIVILDPSDLGTPPSVTGRVDQDLPDTVIRYGLDSSDAMMLLEARRAGIRSVVSLDRDMRRAAVDFDIYTWLDHD